jgi:hypothetical protein
MNIIIAVSPYSLAVLSFGVLGRTVLMSEMLNRIAFGGIP